MNFKIEIGIALFLLDFLFLFYLIKYWSKSFLDTIFIVSTGTWFLLQSFGSIERYTSLSFNDYYMGMKPVSIDGLPFAYALANYPPVNIGFSLLFSIIIYLLYFYILENLRKPNRIRGPIFILILFSILVLIPQFYYLPIKILQMMKWDFNISVYANFLSIVMLGTFLFSVIFCTFKNLKNASTKPK